LLIGELLLGAVRVGLLAALSFQGTRNAKQETLSVTKIVMLPPSTIYPWKTPRNQTMAIR
jgi:hypothetical protein